LVFEAEQTERWLSVLIKNREIEDLLQKAMMAAGVE
jgi:hypothetical protein